MTAWVNYLPDPACDVTCISKIIQDGGQLAIYDFNQNISRFETSCKECVDVFVEVDLN